MLYRVWWGIAIRLANSTATHGSPGGFYSCHPATTPMFNFRLRTTPTTHTPCLQNNVLDGIPEPVCTMHWMPAYADRTHIATRGSRPTTRHPNTRKSPSTPHLNICREGGEENVETRIYGSSPRRNWPLRNYERITARDPLSVSPGTYLSRRSRQPVALARTAVTGNNQGRYETHTTRR